MHMSLCAVTLALAILTSAGPATAGDTDMKGGGQNSSSVSRSVAGELFLTSPDKHSIYQAVADDKGQSIPLTFHPMIGAKVPDSLALFDLPGKVTNHSVGGISMPIALAVLRLMSTDAARKPGNDRILSCL
jgi:hypothetical protein